MSSSSEDLEADGIREIACGFKSFTVSDHSGKVSRDLISGVAGYVIRGGITAILGPSASGKSVLMKSLCGRLNNLKIHGEVYMDGTNVDPKNINNPVAYVPQGDSLIGDLHAREVTQTTAYLKRNEPKEVLDSEVQTLLEKLGIDHVADSLIGTVIFRGLSGGQKKRAEASCELIAAPSLLFLDEPTSGLDSKVSLDVLKTIKDFVKSSEGKHSVILSIHQPNSKILNLFDNILLLNKGKMIFFGTLSEAQAYFTGIEYPCPEAVTPTDYYLQVTDKNFEKFSEIFSSSSEHQMLIESLENVKSSSIKRTESFNRKLKERSDSNKNLVPLWYQVYILIYREYTLAARDPTLYYFQVNMLLNFAFFTGAVFWDLRRNTDNFNLFAGGMLWICFCYVWVHAFKVYYLSNANKRAAHEISNEKYTTLAVLLSDAISTATLAVMFFVIGPIPYFMMSLPAEAYPFMILIEWMTFLSAEAMIALLTKLSDSAVTAMIYAQISLVCLEVFGGGAFIPWNQTPNYWVWLQESNVFYRSSLAFEMQLFDFMEFTCTLTEEGVCIGPNGAVNTCNAPVLPNDTHCEVDGRELLSTTQGINPQSSKYSAFGYLCLLYVCLKIGVALLTYYPPSTIYYHISTFMREQVLPIVGIKNTTVSNTLYTQVPHSPNDTARDDTKALPASNLCRPAIPQTKCFRNAGEAALSWKDFSVILAKNGKPLVDNVSGYVQSGRILALMGPSGAGKTTLLNGLANRAPYAKLQGEVQFSGRTLSSADLTYVPQFDEVNDVMTIFEHMVLVGRLTCADQENMMTRCEELLEVLGLSDKRDVRVRNLSGGETKRLSIGVGLVSNPYVLFLDEPTTGLDSTAAYTIVNYLSTVAKATKVAVIMTIHQPSAMVFDMLDDLFLMAQGKIVYSGSIADAVKYFSSHGCANPERLNPSDYYLDLVQEPAPGDEGSTWSSLYVDSDTSSEYLVNMTAARDAKSNLMPIEMPSMATRLLTMFTHFMKYLLAEPGYMVHRMYALIVIALFEGSLFYNLDRTTGNVQAIAGAMFSTAVAVMLAAVASTALFARDRREAVDRVENGFYDPGVYVVSQFAASAIYNLIITVPFVLIFHYMVGLSPTAGALFYNLLINWGHLILMEAAIMVFIEIMKNDFLCTTAGMIFIGVNMLFSGFFRPDNSVPMAIAWMNYIVPLRYSMEGYFWAIMAGQDYKVTGTQQEISGKDILESYFNVTDVNAWGMFGVLLAYVILFRSVQYYLFAVQTSRIPLPKAVSGMIEKVTTMVNDLLNTNE